MDNYTSISIFDNEVRVPNLYQEGHTLTALEAKVLNRCRAENVGNNVRSKIKDAIAAGTVNEAIAAAESYASEYQFTEAAAGGSSRAKLTPLETECKRLAQIAIKQHIESSGRKVSEVKKADPEKYEAAVLKAMSNEKLIAKAKKNLKDMDSIEIDFEEQAAA